MQSSNVQPIAARRCYGAVGLKLDEIKRLLLGFVQNAGYVFRENREDQKDHQEHGGLRKRGRNPAFGYVPFYERDHQDITEIRNVRETSHKSEQRRQT